MRQGLARQTVWPCWLLIETSDATAGDRAQRALRDCQAAGVRTGFDCYVDMQGQARASIEAVGVPGGRVMIKGTGLAEAFPRVDQLQRWLHEAFASVSPTNRSSTPLNPNRNLRSQKNEIARDRNTRRNV